MEQFHSKICRENRLAMVGTHGLPMGLVCMKTHRYEKLPFSFLWGIAIGIHLSLAVMTS